MTLTEDQIHRIRDLIDRAEANLHAAQQLLHQLTGDSDKHKNGSYLDLAADLKTLSTEGQQIIEGIFDGQNMLGPDGKAHPVPANYASKSKLIQGDRLKLTILPDGKFLYKQIGPIERKHVKGVLSNEEGQYKVLAEGKSYNVLLASVTFFKANVGDEVTIVVPSAIESHWAAIEHVLPKT